MPLSCLQGAARLLIFRRLRHLEGSEEALAGEESASSSSRIQLDPVQISTGFNKEKCLADEAMKGKNGIFIKESLPLSKISKFSETAGDDQAVKQSERSLKRNSSDTSDAELLLSIELQELRRQVESLSEQLAAARESGTAPAGGEKGGAIGGECVVCMSSSRSYAFTPCGHRCVCHMCAVDLVRNDRRCPICRAKVVRILKIIDP
ncbi:unnamed protein product [Polarella glacialis]|uniref:RING-type domain-containing protein n=1 Tax=Polarella glacialis TaxID=89957 RepID=A0A813HAR3_POLGL|nr:unnamed protein product [Polarella glacialis]